MNRLMDKVALVFGAGSSGDGWSNGKAAAVAYAREGARVVAIDRDEQAARETVRTDPRHSAWMERAHERNLLGHGVHYL